MFSFFKKEKWAHVHTTTRDGLTFAVGHPHELTDGKLWIHFYESDKGRRKIESSCSFTVVSQNQVDEYVKSTPVYQERIVRWLSGRYDPEIPKYSEIGEEDTANAPRGKVE